MGKITGKVDAGVKDGTRSQTISFLTQRISPTLGSISQTNVNNQVVGAHNRSALIESFVFPRKALPYRVFVGRFTSKPFDFVYPLSASVWRSWGDSPIAASTGSGTTVYYGTVLSGGLRVPDVSQSMQNQAVVEALNNLQNRKMNILESLAEARQSVNFAASLFSKVLRSYKHVRKGRFRQGINILTGRGGRKNHGDVRDGWLQYNYALLPILSDISGAFALASQGLRKSNSHIRGRRFVSRPYGLPPKPTHFYEWSVDGECDVGAEACFEARLGDNVIDIMQQMGFYNPFSLAWDLLPYSFVLDWLIPIGNTLEALTAHLNVVFSDGYLNLKIVSDFTWRGCNRQNAQGVLPSGRIQNVCQKRDNYVSFPLPRLYIKSPFSTSHVLSALSLWKNVR